MRPRMLFESPIQATILLKPRYAPALKPGEPGFSSSDNFMLQSGSTFSGRGIFTTRGSEYAMWTTREMLERMGGEIFECERVGAR